MFVNPANSDGGGLPGTVVLGSRPYSARFETVNLSTVTDGPDFPQPPGVFGGPAAVWTPFYQWFLPADPGPQPQLYENNFTIDITNAGQPFAAFATWHIEEYTDPPFFGPPSPPVYQWSYRQPARYLVYSES